MPQELMDSLAVPALGFLDARERTFPLAVQAFRSLIDHQPAYLAIAQAAEHRPPGFWLDAEERCLEILNFCDGDRSQYAGGVLQWIEFSYEFLSKQQAYLKTGQYAINSFEDIRRDLYDDDDRMKKYYLTALMFSFLFSSNYAGFFAFFARNLLPRVGGAKAVCDVGCGHGVYLARMLSAAPGSIGLGVDISKASLATTADLLAFREIESDRFTLEIGDVQSRLPADDHSQDAVTCFEVIEHLERPEAALAELRRVLKPGGTLCLSTAIRMESVDHIHLFQDPDEVRKMIDAAGLTLIRDEVIPLTNVDFRDPAVRDELIANPRTALGYVAVLC